MEFLHLRKFRLILNWVFTVMAMILAKILKPDCVKVPLNSGDKEGAIGELVELLASNGLISNKSEVLEAVLQREKTRSTGIGSGIAIPHGKCKSVRELVMAVGVTKKAIDFKSVDGVGVRTVILLASPADQTGPHIQALAGISRLMLDEEFRSALENADSSEDVFELFSSRASG